MDRDTLREFMDPLHSRHPSVALHSLTAPVSNRPSTHDPRQQPPSTLSSPVVPDLGEVCPSHPPPSGHGPPRPQTRGRNLESPFSCLSTTSHFTLFVSRDSLSPTGAPGKEGGRSLSSHSPSPCPAGEGFFPHGGGRLTPTLHTGDGRLT